VKIESDRSHAYEPGSLEENGLLGDPVAQLRAWIDDAYAAGVGEPNAMCLATADAAGRPSGRIVLLRGLDERGLAFYSSYLSRKAREISENPRAAATFFWPQLSRQVRVEGEIAQLPEDESEAYFASRPRGHQLSAWASEQSEPVDARTTLEARLEHFDQRFEGETVPRPHSWGGYVIAPDRFEFWSGRPNRLHDRHEFRLEGRTWTVRRLQP
jgi:pyridoxamine 5'-phosphate oxidase